jgi:tRNA-2-methylthio-N6-dimethylallyladenosine synthase
MADHVPETVKDERLQRLQALLLKQQQDFGSSLVGSTIDTLIEKPGRQAGQKVGRSPWLQPVIVDEKAGEIGDIIQVRITKTGYNSLFAELAWCMSLKSGPGFGTTTCIATDLGR